MSDTIIAASEAVVDATWEPSVVNSIVLGGFQGLSEFLPISSSAHLIILSYFLEGKTLPLVLNVSLHFGTALSLLCFFWKDWLGILKAIPPFLSTRKMSTEIYFLACLFIGSIPAGILGVLFEKKIEALFHHPQTVLLPLAAIGFLLWFIDKKRPTTKNLQKLTLKDSFLIGIGQAFALIPGFSRSGSTIIASRILGYSRLDSARFSFLLGTPAMLGAALLQLRHLKDIHTGESFFAGIITSFVVGIIAIQFLLKYLQKRDFLVFFIYRLIVALGVGAMLFA